MVIGNRPEARGLEMARQRGLNAVCIPSKGLDREIYDRMLLEELRKHGVELVCLAGFMRLLSAAFIREFPNRILNIHPSLLPAFPGLDAQHQALEHGVKITGCTVHFVDEYLDAGPIVIQTPVPVLDDDTVETLSARILKEEHRIYSEAIRIVLGGNYRIEGRRVVRGSARLRRVLRAAARIVQECGELHGRPRTGLHLALHGSSDTGAGFPGAGAGPTRQLSISSRISTSQGWKAVRVMAPRMSSPISRLKRLSIISSSTRSSAAVMFDSSADSGKRLGWPPAAIMVSMNMAVASDHAGFPLKARVIEELREIGHEVADLGTDSTDPVDYPDYARAADARARRPRRARRTALRQRRRRLRGRQQVSRHPRRHLPRQLLRAPGGGRRRRQRAVPGRARDRPRAGRRPGEGLRECAFLRGRAPPPAPGGNRGIRSQFRQVTMAAFQKDFRISTRGRCDVLDITAQVARAVSASGIHSGMVNISGVGSTLGITTLEFEPGCVADLKRALEKIAPSNKDYAHNARWGDENGYAHLRSALVGTAKLSPRQRTHTDRDLAAGGPVRFRRPSAGAARDCDGDRRIGLTPRAPAYAAHGFSK